MGVKRIFFYLFLVSGLLTRCGLKLAKSHQAHSSSFPVYCDSPDYSDTNACLGSRPLYCDSPAYSNSLACIGARPIFCDSPAYANDLACVGPGVLKTFDINRRN